MGGIVILPNVDASQIRTGYLAAPVDESALDQGMTFNRAHTRFGQPHLGHDFARSSTDDMRLGFAMKLTSSFHDQGIDSLVRQ
ncbi:hypothetical protein D3C85_1643600 [compost metagenome]